MDDIATVFGGEIRVAESSSGRDTSTRPTELTLPSSGGPDERSASETRQMTMSMTMDEHGLATHQLNGRRFTEETQIKPQLGTTEVWELQNETHHTHPIHLHLVEFSVIGRGPDGTEAPAPNERVGKDIVRVNPGETVRIAVKFGDFTGQYPWHCHILEHEDHKMMRPFEVVAGSAETNGEKTKGGRNDPDTAE